MKKDELDKATGGRMDTDFCLLADIAHQLTRLADQGEAKGNLAADALAEAVEEFISKYGTFDMSAQEKSMFPITAEELKTIKNLRAALATYRRRK